MNALTLSGSSSSGCSTATGTVEPVYPALPDWNTYILNDNAGGGTTFYDQVGAACNLPANVPYHGCLNSGELRKVVVTGVTSCTNLTAVDSLGAFYWTCYVVGGTATFFSTGFRPTMGLSNLILDDQNFVENFVTVTNTATGCDILETPPSDTWWANDIEPLPDSSAGVQTIGAANSGKILVEDAGGVVTSRGYILNADRLAIVTLGNTVLRYDGHAAGTACGTFNNEKAMICARNFDYYWIEGKFYGVPAAGTQADKGILLYDSQFSRIHKVETYGHAQQGIYIYESAATLASIMVSEVNTHNNTADGIRTDTGDAYLTFHRIRTTKNDQHGLWLRLGDRVVASEIVSSNNRAIGVNFDGPTNSVYTRMLAFNNADPGFAASQIRYASAGAINVTTQHVTVANSGGAAVEGIETQIGTSTYMNIVAANNGSRGIYNNNGDNNFYYNIAGGNNTGDLLAFTFGATNNSVRGNLYVTATTECTEGGSGTNEVSSATCNHGVGNATAATSGLTMAGQFFGNAVTSDIVNTSDTAGAADFDTVLGLAGADWINFESFFRGWGIYDANAFPHANHRNVCGATEDCQIWDFSLDPSFGGTPKLKEIGGTYTAGNPCPASVDGGVAANYLTDQLGNEFLIYSTEIVGDWVGDEDGLCEDNERCIFAPHFGVYQGHGEFSTNECTYSGTTITGVRMYVHPY